MSHINRSKVFKKHGSTDIGLWLDAIDFLPLFNIDETFVIFILSGNIPVDNDWLKIFIDGIFNSRYVLLIKFTWRLS